MTPALFVGDVLAQRRAAIVCQVWRRDAVPHATAVLPLAALMAGAVRAF